MRTISQKTGRVRYFGEIFESPEEMLDIVKSRPILNDKCRDRLNCIDYEDWTGYRSGEEFQQDFINSTVDLSTVKLVERKLSQIQTQEQKRIQFYNDVVGFTPVVPLALMGVPTNMRNSRMVKQKSKIVNVVIDCGASWNISANDIAKAAVEIVGQVVSLEKQGYRVNLMAACVMATDTECDVAMLKIKDANQPLNLSRMMFPFTTASFDRRTGFAWYQRNAQVKFAANYGYVISKYGQEYRQGLKDAIGTQTVLLAVSDVVKGRVDPERAIKEAIQ